MAYSSKVVDHYENPRNVGSLDKADPDVGKGRAVAGALAIRAAVADWRKKHGQ